MSAEPKPEPHERCTVESNGACVMGCPRPGCIEYPSPFTEGRFMCWNCGKFLFTFLPAEVGQA